MALIMILSGPLKILGQVSSTVAKFNVDEVPDLNKLKQEQSLRNMNGRHGDQKVECGQNPLPTWVGALLLYFQARLLPRILF